MPNTVAMAVPTTMATARLIQGLANSSSMAMVAPNRPPTMPRLTPKFRPMPHCTAGTMASTNMPYMTHRRTVSPNRLGMDSSREPEESRSARKKQMMSKRGKPTAS